MHIDLSFGVWFFCVRVSRFLARVIFFFFFNNLLVFCEFQRAEILRNVTNESIKRRKNTPFISYSQLAFVWRGRFCQSTEITGQTGKKLQKQ